MVLIALDGAKNIDQALSSCTTTCHATPDDQQGLYTFNFSVQNSSSFSDFRNHSFHFQNSRFRVMSQGSEKKRSRCKRKMKNSHRVPQTLFRSNSATVTACRRLKPTQNLNKFLFPFLSLCENLLRSFPYVFKIFDSKKPRKQRSIKLSFIRASI